MAVQPLTCVVDSSMCEEHIINPVQHREKPVQDVKTEDGMKPISGPQRMNSGQLRRSFSAFRSVGSLIGNRSCLV
jgi:hypothetical protein